ncbi:hypothetical protein M997_3000 [Proteus hauseri ATCC 700826]|uniref:Lipid/polyisoprenoid-binding YceI-like domain-containing protein n=1 Tax=Proteus hauseri ATCC 700826 TaxID=1354271 RepID=A0AAJ3LSR6_PROHU|nr:hypothetical protein M997_3000 [Proteus hauseri ATCC 700826]
MGSIKVSFPVKTLNMGLTTFDSHIKNSDILDVKKYPIIKFISTK